MPRHARIVLPGVPVHVIQRGNNRAACFVDDEDRRFYLHQTARLSRLAGCALHAYCLMTNHVHLLLTPDCAEGCARFFRRLSLVYAQYANRKYSRTGTLWEGRFRSCLVQSEIYLMACHRYIELNPVRAGMADDPAAYRWSSFRANALGTPDPCITPHAEFLRLGRDAAERHAVYRELFGSALDLALVQKIREATNSGYALGSDGYRQELGSLLGRRVERGVPGRPSTRARAGGPQAG